MRQPFIAIWQQGLLCVLSFGIAGLLSSGAQAKPSASVKTALHYPNADGDKIESLVLPYIFSTEGTGVNLGVGVMRSGFLQEHSTIGATVFKGESEGFALGLWDFNIPATDRLYLTAQGMIGDYPIMKAYVTPKKVYLPPDQPRGGANDSSPDDFIMTSGSSDWSDIKLEYVMPMGNAAHTSRVDYTMQQGIPKLTSAQGNWNPWQNGATVLVLRGLSRYQLYSDSQQRLEGKMRAVELGVLYDNTDFPINPTQGSAQYVAITRDNEWLGSNFDWSFVELEASKYYSFGESATARQRILALNTWLAYSPSWQLQKNDDGLETVFNAPPFMEGATLGGWYRMRAFDMNRFHDKAALYATAEYRHTLVANPFHTIAWLRFLKVDWVQLAAFVEAGRVAPEFNADLIKNLKVDAGGGLRFFSAGAVFRFDIAAGDEGVAAWVMVGQPF